MNPYTDMLSRLETILECYAFVNFCASGKSKEQVCLVDTACENDIENEEE